MRRFLKYIITVLFFFNKKTLQIIVILDASKITFSSIFEKKKN